MRYWLILAVFMIASPVWAEDKAYSKCMENALADYEFGECNAAYLERLDIELNRLWRQVYNPLKPGRAKTALLNEQRKWIIFKDNACLFWHYGFGTMGRYINLPACRRGIIRQRIALLSNLNLADDNYAIISNAPVIACNQNKDPNTLKECAERLEVLQKNDTELNQIWREIRTQWNNEDDSERWQELLNEQRKWVAFKESACQYYSEEAATRWCLSDLTAQRTNELKEVLANLEED